MKRRTYKGLEIMQIVALSLAMLSVAISAGVWAIGIISDSIFTVLMIIDCVLWISSIGAQCSIWFVDDFC